MTTHRILTIIAVLFCCFLSCEKDDICPESTATTPRIVIDFLDIIDRSTTKTVNDLRVRGITDNVLNDVFAEYNGTDLNQIILPLKSNLPNIATETKFQLYKDYAYDDNGTPDDTSDDSETGNPDIITISYIVKEIYVSSACGFKSQYENVTITVETDTDNWILSTEPANDNLTIIDETTTHYNIFH